jgi:LacI family transcriptional regulator
MKSKINDIRDLAKALDLSTTTVSRVLNGKGDAYRIKAETQERVRQAAVKFSYTPSKVARGLKMAKTDTIGLIIPDISNPFFAEVAHGVEREARIKGLSLILCDSGDDTLVEKNLIDLLLSHKVDGMIIAPIGIDYTHIIQTYQSGIPIVLVDRCYPELGLPCINSDNYHGGLDAVNYLISVGHRRIACIQGVPKTHPAIERVRGYSDALRNHGIPVNKSLIVGDDFSIKTGYMETRILFSMDEPPTAIFALSNLIGLGVIKAVEELGLNIPENVSLIAFDEQPYSAYLGTPMSTIDQKKSEMGQLAVDVLLKYISDKESQTKIVNMTLKTQLIKRNSVKFIT